METLGVCRRFCLDAFAVLSNYELSGSYSFSLSLDNFNIKGKSEKIIFS